MIIAIIPVLGRLPLVQHTIARALKIVDTVITVVSEVWMKDYCEGSYPIWIRRRAPLGEKWNFGFKIAKQFDPDHVLFIGSSDWVTENWVTELLPHTEHNDIVGVKGYHLLHMDYEICYHNKKLLNKYRAKDGAYDIPVKFQGMKVGYWGGYRNERRGEPIGLGRILNRDFLKRIDYKPFNDEKWTGMDFNMFNLAQNVKTINSKSIKNLSISTNLWGNLHKFEHCKPIKDEEFLNIWFPGAYQLMKWDNIKLTNKELGVWNVDDI